MKTKFQKWGNSLAIRIPKSLADDAGISPGSTAEITVKNNMFIIQPLLKNKYTLNQLLTEITHKNLQHTTDDGEPIGKEAW